MARAVVAISHLAHGVHGDGLAGLLILTAAAVAGYWLARALRRRRP